MLCIREKIFEYKGFARDRDNSEIKVVIGWVPPHRGITGNEKADGIAKDATTEEKDAFQNSREGLAQLYEGGGGRDAKPDSKERGSIKVSSSFKNATTRRGENHGSLGSAWRGV